MLRRRTLLVVGLVLCSVLMLPVLNVASRLQTGTPVEWTRDALFDTKNQAARWINRALYGLSISTSPAKVIVGRNGWLFLGDEYASTVTVTRRGQTAHDAAMAVRIGAATRAWEDWLRQRGVRSFHIVVGPNKGSVYPEYLPRWAAPAASAPVGALFAQASPIYVDPLPALVAAKAHAGDALYYATDSHWTAWGGSVAFTSLAQAVAQQAPDLRWPDPLLHTVRAIRPRAGGDLAKFLQLSDVLVDGQPMTGLSESGLETIHYPAGRDGWVGVATQSGMRLDADIMPDVSRGPVRVVSPRALNSRKVLWLRDSFGRGLAPSMAATFAETVHVPWDMALQGNLLAQLVERWRPDYVIGTVVERNSLSELFIVPPPGTAWASQQAPRP